MKKIALVLAFTIGSIGSAFAACTGPAIMHDFPGTSFNMSLATNAGDGNCASNVTLVGTLPAYTAVPAFKIDQTTPGTTNLVQLPASQITTITPPTTVTVNQGTANPPSAPWPTIGGELATDATGTFTNGTQTTSITQTGIDGYGTAFVSINGTYGTATAVFEISDDGGTTWFPVQGARINSCTVELGYTSLTNTNQAWTVPVSGADAMRLRSTAVASGTVNVRISISNTVPPSSASVCGTVNVVGPTADGVAAANPPVLTAGTIDGTGTGAVAIPKITAGGIASSDISTINAVTPLMGNGVTGTGSQRVTVASDNTPFAVKIDQTTPGTTNLVSIGSNGTINPATPANWGIGAFAAAMPTNGQGIGLYDGTNMVRAKGDETSGIWVNIKAGAGSGGTAIADNTAFTQGTTNETPAGCLYNTGYANATSGRSTAVRCGIDGTAYTNMNTWAGTVLGAPSNYGTSPGAVAVPGVNAFVTNATPGIANNADAIATVAASPTSPVPVNNYGYIFNGTTMDRMRSGTTTGSVLVNGAGTAGSASGGIVTVQGVASMTKLLVTPDSVALPANQSVNVAQFGGVSTATGQVAVSVAPVTATNTALVTALRPDSPGIITLGPATVANSVPQTISSQYPTNATTTTPTAITGNSTGSTGAVVGTLAAAASKTTFICGFNVSAIGGVATVGPITVAGLTGSSQVYQVPVNATTGQILVNQNFNPCIPASAANTAITITTTADGTATAVDVNSWGYQL